MPETLYNKLKELIYDEEHRECECAQYLQHVNRLLFRENAVHLVYFETEYREHTGDSDYVISGRVVDESGIECVRAYVWELKAPQCYVFEKETKNRLCPTKDLIQAENQLLNYHDELMGNARFQAEFGINHPENVRLGGIIIGRDTTKVQGDFEEAKKAKLYEGAMRCRNRLYYPARIRLMLWNHVLEQLKEYSPIEPTETPEITISRLPEVPSGTISTFGDESAR